jgi:DNA-binding NtrC family response regulator
VPGQEVSSHASSAPGNDAIRVILLHDQEKEFDELRCELNELGVAFVELRTLVEARYLLKCSRHAALLFTAVVLPDSTWTDVLESAQAETPAAPVILVSRILDFGLYLEAMEKGATDFMVPPFTRAELQFVIRSAAPQLPKSARAVSAS